MERVVSGAIDSCMGCVLFCLRAAPDHQCISRQEAFEGEWVEVGEVRSCPPFTRRFPSFRWAVTVASGRHDAFSVQPLDPSAALEVMHPLGKLYCIFDVVVPSPATDLPSVPATLPSVPAAAPSASGLPDLPTPPVEAPVPPPRRDLVAAAATLAASAVATAGVAKAKVRARRLAASALVFAMPPRLLVRVCGQGPLSCGLCSIMPTQLSSLASRFRGKAEVEPIPAAAASGEVAAPAPPPRSASASASATPAATPAAATSAGASSGSVAGAGAGAGGAGAGAGATAAASAASEAVFSVLVSFSHEQLSECIVHPCMVSDHTLDQYKLSLQRIVSDPTQVLGPGPRR